jgi:tripartite-type tricarboxylate transporter receptor subunit TctC
MALAALMFATAAGAQGYPNRPIRIIVPFPAGGLVDTVARHVASKLADALGQHGLAVVIDNRSGASGTLGTEIVAKSAPDGYTLLMVVDAHAVNPHIYKNLRYNIFTDLAPISLVVKIPLVIVAHPSVPANSLKELVALAKSKPGTLTYASAGGAGTAGHLAAEQLKFLAGIDIVHVPYKGGAPAIADLLGGQVALSFIATSVTVPYVRANRLKAIAVSGSQRSSALHNVPTAAESGYPQLDTGSWVGFLAPAGTPKAIVSRLSAETANILKDADIKGKLTEQAMEIVGSTPEQFGLFVRAEHDKWGKLIKDANLDIAQ